MIDIFRKKEIYNLKKKIERLELENILKIGKELPIRVVDINIKDPIPSDSEIRKQYVGTVAGFFINILDDKIKSLISKMRGEFELMERDTHGFKQEEYDIFLKGTINGLWSIYDWGEDMVNEKISYQVDNDLNDFELKELKDNLKQ